MARAVGSGDRLLHTAERPAFLAKNRFGLQEQLPLDWAALAAGIPFYTNPSPPQPGADPMAQMTFDASSISPADPFEPLPAGKYQAQVAQSEMRPTKAGDGQYLWLEFDSWTDRTRAGRSGTASTW